MFFSNCSFIINYYIDMKRIEVILTSIQKLNAMKINKKQQTFRTIKT